MDAQGFGAASRFWGALIVNIRPHNLRAMLDDSAGRPENAGDSCQADPLQHAKDGFVLFGAGAIGRTTLQKLRTRGIEPLCFSDNNPALWNSYVDRLAVLSPTEAARRFGDRAVFVVTIYTGAAVRRQLRAMKLSAISFAALFQRYADTFLPYYALDRPAQVYAQRDRVLAGLPLWHDEISRQEYLAQVRYRLFLDEDLPPSEPAPMAYFPNTLARPLEDEVFVDCGAFDGDSLRAFLVCRRATFRRVIAIEPDRSNFRQLQACVDKLSPELQSNIQLENLALADFSGDLSFSASGSVRSLAASSGSTTVSCTRLDDLLANAAPTFLKMDIEGSEPSALRGGAKVIAAQLPVLAICLYHRQSDLWEIPLLIKSLSDQYCLFLRRHSDDCWEQICYAVPHARLAGN